MNEKLKKIMMISIAGFVVLFVILFAIVACQGTQHISYEKLREKMEKVAKEYFEEHEDALPTEDKETSEYTLKEMIAAGEIAPLEDLLEEDAPKCDGEVTVTNNNGYYLYTTNLECGDKYSVTLLKDKIIEDNEVETGNGLYESENDYYFRGDKVNNWVKFNDELWRIVSIDENGAIKMVQNRNIENFTEWDGHYNAEIDDTGVNTYYDTVKQVGSNIKESLEEYYKNEKYISKSSKPYITTQTLCVGKRSLEDTTKDGKTECSVTLDKQILGALTTYEMIRSSLDEGCNSVTSRECRNYNWAFKLNTSTWLLTASTTKSNLAYSFYYDLDETLTEIELSVLATVKIDPKVEYTEGTGTEEDPYIIGENEKRED